MPMNATSEESFTAMMNWLPSTGRMARSASGARTRRSVFSCDMPTDRDASGQPFGDRLEAGSDDLGDVSRVVNRQGDRPRPERREQQDPGDPEVQHEDLGDQRGPAAPVSYPHLTLPTI